VAERLTRFRASVSRFEKTMTEITGRVRVVYSFPLRLGADRICYTAWQQVNGLAAAGADLVVTSLDEVAIDALAGGRLCRRPK